jgi:hypothetical protein
MLASHNSALNKILPKTSPIKIPIGDCNTEDKKSPVSASHTTLKGYDSSEKLFDPSTSPPENDFMNRLKNRTNAYGFK